MSLRVASRTFSSVSFPVLRAARNFSSDHGHGVVTPKEGDHILSKLYNSPPFSYLGEFRPILTGLGAGLLIGGSIKLFF